MQRLISFILVLGITAVRAQSPQAINDYVKRYKDVAIEEMKIYGIPASVTLAQGIHESGCGLSPLALNSNNHFGIKCHEEWTGGQYHHDDDQPQECFRVYKSAEESFRDHSEFLKTRPRYASLFDLEENDYKGWAKGLKAAGYATNPRYPEIIIRLIEDYKLTQYDETPSNKRTAREERKERKIVEAEARLAAKVKETIAQTPVTPAVVVGAPVDLSKYTFDERIVNGTKAIVYKKNIPFSAITQKYNVTMDQLYTYNDIAPTGRFKENELIYLHDKPLESSYYQYEVAEGESMRDVAQKFGVQLSELYKRNGIKVGGEPVAGEIIVLRGKREYPLKYKADGKIGTGKTSADTPAPSQPAEMRIHKVEPTDTLYSIAKQYNIPVENLKKINGLKDTDIKIGQTIIVSL